MLLIDCPHIGPRNRSEFRFGGEYKERPADTGSDEAWVDYLYLKENRAGLQREWWYHRPSHTWFIAERDTTTQQIERTYLWEERDW